VESQACGRTNSSYQSPTTVQPIPNRGDSAANKFLRVESLHGAGTYVALAGNGALGPVLFGKDEGWNVDSGFLRSKKIRAVAWSCRILVFMQLTER